MRSRTRRRNSLQNYSDAGWYFLTINTASRLCFFGKVKNSFMGLSLEGSMAVRCVEGIPQHFSGVLVDIWVVMPDHLHLLLGVAPYSTARYENDAYLSSGVIRGRLGRNHQLIPEVMSSFKSAVSREIRSSVNKEFGWQRSYYDVRIRSKKQLEYTRSYIRNNPRDLWEEHKA